MSNVDTMGTLGLDCCSSASSCTITALLASFMIGSRCYAEPIPCASCSCLLSTDEEADFVILPSEDPVVDTGLEVGDVPTTGEWDDGDDSDSVPAAKRTVQPDIWLSCDEPREPTDKPFIIVHRGMKIYLTCNAGDSHWSPNFFKQLCGRVASAEK